jgi:glycosyltransferase involved in cell wall biosynthesis
VCAPRGKPISALKAARAQAKVMAMDCSVSDPFNGPCRPRIAIVHDWLVTLGGGEKVLKHLIRLFPDADVYAALDKLEPQHRSLLAGRHVSTSFVQAFPKVGRWYWYYAALMPLAYEALDLSGYDLVLSNSHAFAKSVLPHPNQLHICYAHSTPRFLYDLQEDYLRRFAGRARVLWPLIRAIFHYLRLADLRAAQGVDRFIANSKFVQRRIEKAYRRDSIVIYPGVETELFEFSNSHDSYYLTGSFMSPFKRLDTIVQAFSTMPDRRLVLFGDGPQRSRLAQIATPNVELVGRLGDSDLASYLRNARAYVFAAPEDFGLIMVEAQACGTPVIAYGVGGASEIIRDLGTTHPTGVLFSETEPYAIVNAIRRFETNEDAIDRMDCRINAERFSIARFEAEFLAEVHKQWRTWCNRLE